MVPDSIIQLLGTDYPDKKRFSKAINALKRPQNVLKKKLITKLTNGKKNVSQSFRIQYNDARGPFMGGLKLDKNISEDSIKKMAFEEAIKTAIVDLPFGGAFGGVEVDLKKVTNKDLERLLKLYSQFLTIHIGTWKDVVSNNGGTNAETQGWMMEAFEKKKKIHAPATFLSNVHNLDGATIILDEFLKSTNFVSRFRKLDVAVSGFNNRGYVFSRNLRSQSFRVVAVSDESGGIVNSNGFDVEEVKKLKDKFTTLKEISVMCDKEFVSKEKLLELPVDILVVVNDCDIEINIKSEVLPSILLNSGFSVLNHLDWVQKIHGYKWSREEISKKLRVSMQKTFAEVKSIVDEKKISYNDACYYLGTKRIIDAMMERGRV